MVTKEIQQKKLVPVGTEPKAIWLTESFVKIWTYFIEKKSFKNSIFDTEYTPTYIVWQAVMFLQVCVYSGDTPVLCSLSGPFLGVLQCWPSSVTDGGGGACPSPVHHIFYGWSSCLSKFWLHLSHTLICIDCIFFSFIFCFAQERLDRLITTK